MSILTGEDGHVGHHILNEEEKNRRINTALEYDPHCLRVIFKELSLVYTQSMILITMVSMLVPLGNLSLTHIFLLHLFGFIVT